MLTRGQLWSSFVRSGEIWGCHYFGGGTFVGRTRDVAKHRAMHSTNPQQKVILPKTSIVPRWRRLGLYKTFLEVELLCQRIFTSVILLTVTKLFSAEIVPINIPQGHVWEACFLKTSPTLLSYVLIFASLAPLKKWYLSIIYLHFCYCSEFQHLFRCLWAIYIPFAHFSIMLSVFS